MSVIAHNIIAIILICVSKGRGRARGPVVPCVVGCPSPPRPCGSLCVFHVLWVIAPAPPRLLRQEAWWEGGGIPWGTSTVTWMTCACLLSAGGGGGHTIIPCGGGGGGGLRRGDAAPYLHTQSPRRREHVGGSSCSTNHASPTIHASHQNTLQVGNQEAQVVQPESEQTKPRHTMKPPKPQGESTTLQFAGPHIFRSAISPHLILWPKTPKTRPLSQGSRGRRCLRISGPRGAEVDGGVPGLVGSFGLRFTCLGVGGSMV